MTIGFEQRDSCPVCGEKEQRSLCKLSYSTPPVSEFLTRFYGGRIDIQALSDNDYLVSQCSRCEFVFQSGVLNEEGISALYSYWVDNDRSLQKKQTAKTKLFRQYAGHMEMMSKLFPQPPHTIRVLEYGMGWGYWSRMAQAHGFNVDGFELAPERVSHARSMGVNVIDRLPDPGSHYQFVFANQVFEHLADPLASLREISERLTRDGIVYLRVPDGRGIAQKLRHSGWSAEMDAIHPLEHINCFTRKTLIELARRAGLTPARVPLRLDATSLWGGIRRELTDRFFTTHVYFRRNHHITEWSLTLK